MALGAGLRFAVPEINNIRTNDWSEAIGAVAFGPYGQVYRVVAVNETATASTTWPAGGIAHLETASSAISQTGTYGQLMPFIVGTINSNTALIAGFFPNSGATNNLQWLQVAGPFTATLTASAEASAANAYYVQNNATAWQSTASANAWVIASGAVAYNGGGHTSAQSTCRLHLMPAAGMGLFAEVARTT